MKPSMSRDKRTGQYSAFATIGRNQNQSAAAHRASWVTPCWKKSTNNHIDLVVAGTHGRTGLRRLLLGSAVEGICRVATCPVLTVGPDHPASRIKLDNILVPTDLSEESMRSLPFVLRIAGAYGAKVTVLHVLPEETAGNPDTQKLV